MVCMAGYACRTPEAVQEARQIVTQADSLRTEGQMYDDSTQLAQAYIDLGRWLWVYSTDYAHACYHYGRLLRAKDNPVAAMECFINATHSRTHDYHILGRVYSNMGEIAHLAGEYQLSYDMFERSAEMFLQGEDTIAHYLCLYHMAYEMATVADSTGCLSLLRRIEQVSTTQSLYLVTLTRAELFLKCKQYDSALHYASNVYMENQNNVSNLLIKAQAYSYKGNKDSAAWYAERVVRNSESSLYDLNNALYILTNDDQTKDKTAIRKVASERSDTQKLIEIKIRKLSQATQLLEQDLNHKPNYLYIVGIVILAFGLCISIIAISLKKKKLSQQQTKYMNKRQEELEMNCIALRNCKNLKKELDWENYDSMCCIVNARLYGIAHKLASQPNITSNDVRICILFLIDLPYSNIAEILNLSPKSIAKLKSITAHKLNATMRNLRTILIDMACQIDTYHTP